LPSEIENITLKSRDAAIELLVRFFREEGFATPRSRIVEHFDRMLADPFCWCALATTGETAQAVITVSTVLYVEWGRLGEIGDLYVLPEHRRNGLARRLVEHAKAWCPCAGLLGGYRDDYIGRRAASSPQSLLRQVRLRTIRSNERLSYTARLIVWSLSRSMHNGYSSMHATERV
jgi:GNAT superfamily N-acetyltransferase